MKVRLKFLIVLMTLLPPLLVSAQFDTEDSGQGGGEKQNVSLVTREDRDKIESTLAGDDDKAFSEAIANVLGKDPKNLRALNALAVRYLRAKKPGLAIVVLNRALQSHPEEPALYNNLGVAQLQQGDRYLANLSFRKAIGQKSDHVGAGLNLGSTYLEFGDAGHAEKFIKPGYEALGSDLGRGKDEAVKIANNYALALLGVGEGKKAQDIFQRIDESETRNEAVLLNYAIILTQAGTDKKQALRIISRLRFITEDPGVRKRLDELEQQLDAE